MSHQNYKPEGDKFGYIKATTALRTALLNYRHQRKGKREVRGLEMLFEIHVIYKLLET